jgi:uncharacterized membrane protein YkoI
MRHFSFCALVCLVVGCGSTSSGELIPLDKVPESMLTTAKEKLPEVQFESALKRSDGTYEVRGKDKQGKVRDVEFSATGEVLEIE